MGKNTMYITKQESTKIKIELAGEAIKKENDYRRKHNKAPAVVEGIMKELPIIRPSFIRVNQRSTVDSVTRSNKYLCGRLSVLCDVMRKHGIPYPWKAQEVSI
jgi:hypothetical protein